MIRVLKDNILVKNLDIDIKRDGLSVDSKNLRDIVEARINSGVVIASNSPEVKVGDIVGYSSYDGVNVKFGSEKYILLSTRETQAKILSKDLTDVRFGTHNREDSAEFAFKRDMIGSDNIKVGL